MSPIRTLLVDDEPLARSLLRELLADFPALAVTGEAANGTEALAALHTGAYDVVFLDVQMPDLDGVQVLRRLQAAGQPLPLVVFVTAYDQYAVQAFALHAVDYLLKPLDPDRFADCVGRVQQQLALRQDQARVPELEALLHGWTAPAADYQDQFLVKLPARSFFVPAAEVCYFEATGNGVLLHAAGGHYPLRTALGQLAERLDPAVFLRIHRSCIVNPAHIVDFKHWSHGEYLFRMANGQHVTSSRSYSAGVQQLLKRFA
ncbi:two component transcriptional regulator, LytTR family [Hymenobacter daecheongensis DSM 21074]|uniref:Two component transcriptional regulator, LytTR family n=1 Tax=Hymenobacter daecheongensis DSM 21074 TaxID=1121955 RepID=A0A1M6M4W3_9BACT|nr:MULTISPECIES: LytTR family DNA-binding domain-containing protein [Hymenobacter]MBC6992157.1 response regulator transcription factor [Hymenobacter sp. BT491]SHJ78499.1 two component transcriptional regulator, LytTR family [Hymenobacter daecheongensis DSM 21074]